MLCPEQYIARQLLHSMLFLQDDITFSRSVKTACYCYVIIKQNKARKKPKK